MRFIVGIDDTDSSRGYCTTYLGYRIASDLPPEVAVVPYPRLVRLNPNVPFKTRGNAAVCLQIEASDPAEAFRLISAKVKELSDVGGGANSGMVFLEDPSLAHEFIPLYEDALSGIVNPRRARRLLTDLGVKHFELGNGMGLVGAAASLGFDEASDHTFELIAYRERERWGTPRVIDSTSVKDMDAQMFPHLFNNYDYQKRKVLIAPHGPDPVFIGLRGDSPKAVAKAFGMLRYGERLEGRMTYVSNQHTDAHLHKAHGLKAYYSGWVNATVESVRTGEGGHVYLSLDADGRGLAAAAYEPTGDLRRAAKLLRRGDRLRAFGGLRRGTTRHSQILNLEKFELKEAQERGPLAEGIYISSPRANRHLTKPLIRYGREDRTAAPLDEGWLWRAATQPRARVRSR